MNNYELKKYKETDIIDAMRYCYNDIITAHNYSSSSIIKPFNGDSIEKVIFHDPATIIFWDDGSKTIVKCSKDDIFDYEKGLAMAICKRVLGPDYKRVFKDYRVYKHDITTDMTEQSSNPLSTIIPLSTINEDGLISNSFYKD